MLATNTQIFSGRFSRASLRRTSFKISTASADFVCSVHHRFGCLSGHLIVVSGLGNVKNTPMSMVTRNDLSPTQPCVPRLESVLSVMTAHRDQTIICTPVSLFPTGVRSFTDGWPSLLFALLFYGCHSALTAGFRMSIGGLSSCFHGRSSFPASVPWRPLLRISPTL
jgi:hypothetical protein